MKDNQKPSHVIRVQSSTCRVSVEFCPIILNTYCHTPPILRPLLYLRGSQMLGLVSGYPRHMGKQGKWPKKSQSGKTQGIWKFCQNTGNFVCSSCKFPDSKGKGYCDICCENFHLFPEVSFVYAIVTNYVNLHRENLRLDRKKTGETQGI